MIPDNDMLTDAYVRAEGLAASVSRCLATAIKNTANPLATLSTLSHRCMRHAYSKHEGSRLQACSLMFDLLQAATAAGSGTLPHACDESVPERAVVAVCVFFLPRLADPQLQIAVIACRALQVRSTVMLSMQRERGKILTFSRLRCSPLRGLWPRTLPQHIHRRANISLHKCPWPRRRCLREPTSVTPLLEMGQTQRR